jgi:hypothetical protein
LHPEVFPAKAENRKVKTENGARFYAAMAESTSDSTKGCGTCAR